jgi:ribosomal protein L30E
MGLIEDIKEGLEKGIIVLGENSVIKGLKRGKLKRVVLSTNCAPGVKEEITFLCSNAGIKYEDSKRTNTDLGAACKRSHSVSVLGFIK